ncbi:HK97 family phage prohead protease [Streptosporangium saharense]|uniref:HK97 family phage prohead protease n=1 Tax=Streptosporangium saharense TaxID=1706840 RepID=UPI00344888E0
MNLAERAKTGGRERRAYPVQLEVRGKAGALVEITGYATVYEQTYEMWDMFGSYDEVVREGAGTKTLSENPQTQLLLNHGGLSMAYTHAGTLRLAEEPQGLHLAADVNTARGDIRDMVLAIEDGNVDEMSFAFRVTRQQWSPDYMQRDIIEYSLHRGDVSVVNFGANPATSVALRGLDLDRMGDDQIRALYERLGRRLAPPAPPAPVAPETQRRNPLSLFEAEAAVLG